MAAGVLMLAMKIPEEDYAWHQTAVDAILVFFVCLDAVLLARNKVLGFSFVHFGNKADCALLSCSSLFIK